MPDHMQVAPEELKGFQGLLERNAGHFTKINSYAANVASDTSGFTGLMTALIPAVEGITALYGETLEFANKMLLRVKDEIGNAEADYRKVDEHITGVLRGIEADLEKMKI